MVTTDPSTALGPSFLICGNQFNIFSSNVNNTQDPSTYMLLLREKNFFVDFS